MSEYRLGAILATLAALYACFSVGRDVGERAARAECAVQRKVERVKPLPQTAYEYYPKAAVPARFGELAKKLERKP